MENSAKQLAAEATKLAAEVPPDVLELAAEALLGSDDVDVARRHVAERIAQPHLRRVIDGFLSKCTSGSFMSTAAMGASLLTAAASERSIRFRHEAELVWTGPHSDAVAFRRTEQAILQILDSATSRITLASYAVYAIPRVRASLVEAAGRRVRINVILETSDRMSGQAEYNTLKAMGEEVAACSSVYYWPQEKRQKEGQKAGILHVKCLVADSRWLLVSSANLTEYAFSINMELGLLLTGGGLPRQVEGLFDSLIGDGHLLPV